LTERAAVSTETLITLTTDIVAAHVSFNDVAPGQVPALIEAVFGALSGLGEAPAANAPPAAPAVPIRSSVSADHVICLDCGRKMKMLKRHLAIDHGLTTSQYRQRWGLSDDHLLVAPNYAAKRRELAVKIGLGRKPVGKRGRKKKA
jgi:predicted transcriptional regulator